MSASGTTLAARQVPAHEVARMVRQLCGLQGSDQDVFSRPDVVRLMCEKTLYTVLCIDARESALPFHATELEMHKDAITELVFIKYATRLCLDFGIDFEPTRDMYSPQPDPKRVQYILTKIVSFLKFRDVEVLAGQEKFKPYLEPFNGLIEALDQLRAKNESNEDVMHRAYEKRARVESSVDMLRQQVVTIEQTMAPKLQTHESLRQRNEELTRAVEAAHAQLDETRAALQQATAACDECRTVLSEPPSVINEAIAALRHTIAAHKAELTDLDAKARALGLRRACLLRIEKSLGKSMAHLQVLEELRAKYKQAKKETKNKEAICAAEKDKEEKARKRLKHLQGVKMHDVEERTANLETMRTKAQQQFEEDLKKVQEQKQAIDAEVAEMQNQTAQLIEDVNAKVAQQEASRDRHEAIVAQAQQAINAIAEQAEIYNEEICAAMAAADSL